ncbi:MAG: hypothetical protein AAFU85_05520, partial [Planctomycetota bacterium]
AAADEYLRHVLSRYGSTTHYRDDGEVRLSVEADGVTQRFTAPMRVLLDGTNIWIAAYDGRLWSDGDRTLGWIHDEKSNHHDGQVVVGPTAAPQGRPELKRLLNEPTLREKIVAGLGGPPPQLEWLLEPDPMAKLFDGKQTKVEYAGIRSRDDLDHIVVEAVADDQRYRFWIDGQKSLIRSVDLPIELAEENPSTPDGWRVRSLELRLPNATFAPAEKRSTLGEMRFGKPPSQPKYVRAMVPLPPRQPHRSIGRALGRFEARDASGRWTVNERGAGSDFTFFAVVPSDSRGASVLQSLPLIDAQVPPALRARLTFVILVDEDNSATLDPARFRVIQDRRTAVSQRMGLAGGASCLVDQTGRVLWIADAPQWIDPTSVAAILVDAAAGIDVPTRMIKAWENDQSAYLQKLRELRAEAP